MAALTGLAARAARVGVATVFPDGVGRVWNDSRAAPRLARREGIDDIAFIRALVDRLTSDGTADPARVYLTGISNGSFLTDTIARQGAVRLAGIVLCAGPGTETARRAWPRPVVPLPAVIFHGSADPLVPYGGGPIGAFGRMLRPRAGRPGGPEPGRGAAIAAETAAGDWAAANGHGARPVVDSLVPSAGDLGVTRMRWSTPGHPPVVLYRVDGGGHTWPGGAQYLPARLIGPSTRTIDATAVLLSLATAGPV